MIRSFRGIGTENIFDGTNSKAARTTCPEELWPKARRKLDDINQVLDYKDLATPPSNRLHRLRSNRKGQWAIAINRQYRICFRWDGVDAFDVEVTDYH